MEIRFSFDCCQAHVSVAEDAAVAEALASPGSAGSGCGLAVTSVETAPPLPAPFTALMRKVYCVPLTSGLTTCWVVDAPLPVMAVQVLPQEPAVLRWYS